MPSDPLASGLACPNAGSKSETRKRKRASGANRVIESAPRSRPQDRYDQLWSSSIGRIRAGKIQPDAVLAAGKPDRRRGLTLIARPSPEARKHVAAFLRQLRRLEPDQYYYAPSQLHVT